MTKPARIAYSAVALGCCLAAFDCVIAAESDADLSDAKISYGKQGLQFDDGTGNNFLWFGVRLQTRWANTKVTQDVLPGAPISESSEIAVNRGRLKLGGHLVRPAFTIYLEYDIVGSRLLDLRATYRFTDWLSLRAGQWKSEFNRERIDSSGKQQFVERSIVTPWFTLDRQQAIMATGRVGQGSRGDTSYWAGYLSGAGRGGDRKKCVHRVFQRRRWTIARIY